MLGSELYQISFVLNLADAMSGPLGQANQQLGGFEGRLLGIHKASQNLMVTGNIMGAIGGSMLKPLDTSISKMADFQDAMVGVKKTTGMEDSALDIFSGSGDLAKLSGEILNLTAAIPGVQDARVELAGITEAAGQLGITGTNSLIKFTEITAKMAAVSDLTSAVGATQFAKISNIFKLDIIKDLEGVGSVVNELSNKTTATAGYITESMMRIGQPIKSMDYSQIAGLSATLSDIGLTAEIGSTAVKGALMDMQVKVGTFARFMGTTEDAWKIQVQTDGMASFQAVLTKINALPLSEQAEAIAGLFGRGAGEVQTIRGLAGGLDLLAANLKTSATQMGAATSLQQEFDASLQSIKAQQQLMGQQYDLISVKIGGLFIPVLQTANAILGFVGRGINSFVTEHQTLAKIVVFTAAGIGLLLVIVGGGLATIGAVGIAITSGISVLSKLSGILKIASAAQWLLNLAMSANPIMLIVIGIGAAIAVIIYFKEEIFGLIKAVGQFFGLIDEEATKSENHLEKIANTPTSIPSVSASSSPPSPTAQEFTAATAMAAPVQVQYVPVSLPKFRTDTAGGLSAFKADTEFGGGKSLFEVKVTAPIEFNFNGVAFETLGNKANQVGDKFRRVVEEVLVETFERALVKKGLSRG